MTNKRTAPDETTEDVTEAAKPVSHPLGSERPNDIPLQDPALPNSSFTTRAKRLGAKDKVVKPSQADTK